MAGPSTLDEALGFPARLRQLARERPDAVVLRHVAADGTEVGFTWPELDRRSSQLASALAARGLGTGDRLAIALRTSPQLVLSTLAAWRLGAVPVPLRWDLPEWELERLRSVVDAAVELGPDDVGWIDATADDEVRPPPDVVSPAVMGICSSGSTGTPKVIVSGRPAVHDDRLATPMIANWAPVPRPQTILVLSPMYHANGFAMLFFLFGGDDLVVMEAFDAAQVVDLVEAHRITTFTATPTMLERIADLPGIEERDLSSLEWILQGAAPMPPALVDRWIDLVGAERIVMAYSMTESLGITGLRADEWLDHRGSVGRPLRGTEVRILGEGGDPLPTGEVGDVYLRSPGNRSSTYLGATSPPVSADGFATVGDMGWLDEDGYLYIADRRTDLIISGGANVFPAEVEAALLDHPEVADAVVIGLRDEEWGRRVHALVEPRDPARPPTADELRAFARSHLAPYKVPKSVEVVERIPRSAATKVNRAHLVAERGG